MNNIELSNEFDILANSFFSTNSPFGIAETSLLFDEYEKSVFLTKAQDLIVTSLYNGKLTGESFELTEELRRYLSDLIKTYTTSDKITNDQKISNKSVFFKLPDDVRFITYEAVKTSDESLGCMNGTILEVVPVTQDDYHKVRNNPFKQPNKRRAVRLDTEGDLVEIISDYNIESYQLRYVANPSPIILSDLPKDLSICNQSNKIECKLNPALHRTILELAVQLAIQSRVAGKS